MDNERPIEKLLRRYAKKRRDDSAGAGLELHPATRRLLQGEVARQFGVRRARGEASGSSPDHSHLTPRNFTNLWPRLVWALPVLIVLGIGVWTVFQSKKPQKIVGDLAQTEAPSPMQSRESLGRTEIPAQPVGGASPPNETVLLTLADADASRAKDTSGVGLEEGKLKADRAPAPSALNTPVPSIAATAPEVANLDKVAQQKAVAGREALERLARDARTDKLRDLTLAERRAPAEEPATSLGARLETARALSDTPPEVRSFGGKAAGVVPNRAAPSLSATPPSAAAPSLSLATKSPPTKVEYHEAQLAEPTVVQRFVQTTSVSTSGDLAKKSPQTPQVLDAFQVEQTGNQLRVIDSDGSSYDGSIQFATAEALDDTVDATKQTGEFKRTKLAFQQSFREGVPESQSVQNYFFRVTGTNRTLRQPVAFTGNLLVMTNALPAAETGLTLSPTTKSQFPKGQTDFPTLQNSSISGKVQLGTDQEMRINAVPVVK